MPIDTYQVRYSPRVSGGDGFPTKDGCVVKTKLARHLGCASGLTDDLCDVHAAKCGASPQCVSSPNVGSSRTCLVGRCHNPGMENKSTMGSRLRDLRKSRGLTQVAVSVETGIDRSHLSKIESDDDAPGRDNLQALATFYKVSMDYLQAGTKPGSAHVGDQAGDSGADSVWVALGHEIELLDDETQDAIVTAIRSMIQIGGPGRRRKRPTSRKR